MVVGCQSHAPAAFTPRDIPGTHFHEGLSRPQGHGLVGTKYVTEKSSDKTATSTLGVTNPWTYSHIIPIQKAEVVRSSRELCKPGRTGGVWEINDILCNECTGSDQDLWVYWCQAGKATIWPESQTCEISIEVHYIVYSLRRHCDYVAMVLLISSDVTHHYYRK
jgi:hypothetical protein